MTDCRRHDNTESENAPAYAIYPVAILHAFTAASDLRSALARDAARAWKARAAPCRVSPLPDYFG
jgi:hypothetical protein